MKLTHWLLGDMAAILNTLFSNSHKGYISWTFPWHSPEVNAKRSHWWSVNTGLGNCLVLSGNEPLHELMLTHICRHMVSLNHSRLICYHHIGILLDLCCLTIIGIPITKARWSNDHLIFIMEITTPKTTVLYWTGPTEWIDIGRAHKSRCKINMADQYHHRQNIKCIFLNNLHSEMISTA